MAILDDATGPHSNPQYKNRVDIRGRKYVFGPARLILARPAGEAQNEL